MNKKVLIDKQALIDELMKIPGVGSNSDALETIKRFPLYEPQKPVVPKFVADWISFCKNKNKDLNYAIHDNFLRNFLLERFGDNDNRVRWLTDYKNQEIFARAWLEDYEVEEEPLYEVIIGDLYLIKKFNNRNDFCFDTSCSLCAWEKSAYQLTEVEIKAIDERYWPFAVPVEEAAEG